MLRNLSAFVLLLLLIQSCSYTIKIKDGQTAFDQKQYDVAIPFLKKEFKNAKRRTEKGKIAYQIAQSFSKNNDADNAQTWFKTAYNNNYGVEALRGYADALKQAERYEEAIEEYENLGLEIGSPYEVRKDITACKVAKDWKKIPEPEFQVAGADFNSGASEFSPVFYKNELIITSDRAAATGEEKYKWTGRNFMDLFLVNESGSAKKFSEIFNLYENEGTITFNDDFTEAFFTRCGGDIENTAYCQIYKSEFNGETWTTPKRLAFQTETVNYMHPALSADGESLYFASNHPDGWGGFDIYVSDRTPDGWDIPRLLSRSINTSGNEVFPTIHEDTLYFSSNFLTGMGGLDIFKTYPLNAKSWAPPQNMLPPINSGADDFGFAVNNNFQKTAEVAQIGYFSSSRIGGQGLDDIYSFERLIPKNPPPPPPVEDTVEVVYKMILDVYVLEKIYQNPNDPNSKVIGRRPITEATIQAKFNNETQNLTTSTDGLVTLELEEETTYDFFASKNEYLTKRELFSSKGIGKDPSKPIQKFELEIVLDKIFKEKEITLDNIYYDYNKWNIREDAKPTLNALSNALQLNPNINIQLGSHTDCRGALRYNTDLSQKRAQSAVQYLIESGINPDRLLAKGFGETSPAIDCVCSRCTDNEHQANRRTTFKILN